MSNRQSRPGSIPIPRSVPNPSSSRNIETVISIPPLTSAPSRATPSTRPIPEPRRVGLGGEGSRFGASGSADVSVSPTRSTARSASMASSMPGRRRTPSRTSFEPRVIRGIEGETMPFLDYEYIHAPSTSPTHGRRVSAPSVRTSGLHKPIVPQHVVASTTPIAFQRPAYLEFSALRHLLQPDGPVPPIAARTKGQSSVSNTRPQPVSTPHSDDDDDSVATNSPPPKRSRPGLISASPDQIFKLPSRWGDQERHPHINVSADGRELSYGGSTSINGDKDAAAARTTISIPPACGIYYYEVEILGKEAKSHISIGFSGTKVKFSRLPGWEPNSWGYYGEDGSARSTDRSATTYSGAFGAGDVIGCGIDFTTNQLFYTKNGTLIGPVFENVGKSVDLYPAIGMQKSGDAIRANFGQDPFNYDIEYHVQQQANAIWNSVMDTRLDYSLVRGHRKGLSIGSVVITNDTSPKRPLTDDESNQVLKQLVTSYLIHHGYAKTVRALENGKTGCSKSTTGDEDVEMNGASPSKSDSIDSDIESRTNIVNSVLAGDIDNAITSIQTHYPSVLEADDHLILFKLRCRKFVELILETTEMKKKMKRLREKETEKRKEAEVAAHDGWMDEDMDMDVDEDATGPLGRYTPQGSALGLDGEGNTAASIATQYEAALNAAIMYGQQLSNDHQSDPRPELQQLFKKTFGIVAWEDPLEAGGPTAELVGDEARAALAHEINQAILRSQGRPAQPVLEMVYRHSVATVNQLGLLGVGKAAFADVSRELA
ncbi:hypothetical protein D9619_003081 [Psilocybe cf. subviscida]|uniref:B30.2/SPRY domain-containing protein n=1 Tax=Psilocybe cf. subviscida TaxID=2480587 RepID=A0A8H5AVQ5_9AGAR|nr:hypothetical protein D9619_003081 [Psilocybe cf. subviscida]